MSQTVINKFGQAVAIAGQLSDNMEGVDIVSRFNAEASNTLAFGCGVKAATSFRGLLRPAASTDVVEGISVWGPNHMPGATGDLDQTNNGLKPNAGLEVLRRGRIWALVDAGLSSVTPYSDRGWVRCVANGGNTVIGALSNAQDGTNNIDCTTKTQFVSPIYTAADGSSKIAEVDCDFVSK